MLGTVNHIAEIVGRTEVEICLICNGRFIDMFIVQVDGMVVECIGRFKALIALVNISCFNVAVDGNWVVRWFCICAGFQKKSKGSAVRKGSGF
jgi:hypothetical protein